MSSSWPVGVTTQEDLNRYARTLFGDCKIENLLTGTPFARYPGCFLIRVKGACNNGEWKIWPELIDKAMEAAVQTYGRDDVIQAKSRAAGAFLSRTLRECTAPQLRPLFFLCNGTEQIIFSTEKL